MTRAGCCKIYPAKSGGVEHWHAATPESGVTYLAITGNEATKWLEPVSEKDYLGINVKN